MPTPFEKAGYTKDTVFRVLKDSYFYKQNDYVKLYEDDGSYNPWFVGVGHLSKNKEEWFVLPGRVNAELSVVEGLSSLDFNEPEEEPKPIPEEISVVPIYHISINGLEFKLSVRDFISLRTQINRIYNGDIYE